MNGKLTDIATGELLAKFGAGNHKPGSGSASAFQGMLSAQMLRTVIELTNEEKRRSAYSKCLPELNRIRKEIDQRIYSDLESLFQKDSEQFDKVISLREERDKEPDFLKKRELSIAAKAALTIATEIPLEIAELCIELGDFSAYVFDNGFKSARGDSGVALTCAIAGIAGCLSIIDLNLISLPTDETTERIRLRKTNIKVSFERLSSISVNRLKVLEIESSETRQYNQSIAEFQAGNLADSVVTNTDIEKIVRRLQNVLWMQRDRIWKKGTIENPIHVLSPDIVLRKVMEYAYIPLDTLGMFLQNDELVEIAGLIDKKKRLVQVSKNFPEETQRFTLAHELGHAILHKGVILHRDRPIDGAGNTPRSRQEMQADKFAAYFLMPSNLVKDIFIELFEMERFVINENTVLAIRAGTIGGLRNRCRNARGLARLLASTDYYGGKSFKTMAAMFEVSIETMAIRLEELGLIEF